MEERVNYLLKNNKNFFMLLQNFIFCATNMVTIWLIVKSFFVRNENSALYIVITYNEFQPTIKVENLDLCYWDHNEGKLLQKFVFFFV